MTLSAPIFKPHDKMFVSDTSFYRLVLLAILLRIIIMPMFAHHDLLSEARRIFEWDQSGILLGQFGRDATALFQLFFYKFFSIFIENQDVLFGLTGSQFYTASPADYFEFVSHRSIFRILFILKLPYLFADLVTAWALFIFCQRSVGGGRAAVLFWLFNPITIFAFYVFGRFESIPIMFCMLGLLAAQRHKLIVTAVLISICVNAREIFIFLGPLFIAICWSPTCKHYHLFTRLAATLLVMFALLFALQFFAPLASSNVPDLLSDARIDHLFRFRFGMYALFPLVYFSILVYAWVSSSELESKFVFLNAMIFLAFFFLSLHSPHYTAWLVIFPCIYLSVNTKLLRPLILFCFAWFANNLMLNDLGYFTFWLASPWSLELNGLPSFVGWYEASSYSKILSADMLQQLTRGLYGACLAFISAQIVITYRSQHQ